MAEITGTGRLKDKIAIITGSSGGIGREIALRYAAEGAYVVCSDLKADVGPVHKHYNPKATHDAINENYPADGKFKQRAIFVKTDVSQPKDVENLVQETVKVFGRLDIIVNNAGIAAGKGRHLTSRTHEVPVEAFDQLISVNLKGVWLGCKYAIAQMLAQPPHLSGDRGWVINVASILGFVGFVGGSEYTTSKGAVVNLTRTLALEYGGDRIHANALAPGFIQTPLMGALQDPDTPPELIKAGVEEICRRQPLGSRLGEPEEIAGAAVFLASQDASFVTGHTVLVDGGYTAA